MTYSASISAVTAADFSKTSDDTEKHVWTGGKMAHLIKALDGQRVSIVLETATGWGMSDVELVGVRSSMYSSQRQVGVRETFANGSGKTIWFSLDNVGTVMFTHSQARWAAFDSYRKAETAAMKLAWEKLTERTGLKPLDLHGKLRVSQWESFVNVSWRPNHDRHSYHEAAGRMQTWKFSTDELESVHA